MPLLATYTSTGPQMDAGLDYNITVEFQGSNWTEPLQGGVTFVLDQISQIVIGDKPDLEITPSGASEAITVDDLFVTVTLDEGDGLSGNLGSAIRDFYRTGEDAFTSITGSMRFDIQDAENLSTPFNGDSADSDWALLVGHEMLHVMGIGSTWEDAGFIDDTTVAGEIRYTGVNALYEYQYEFADAYAADPNAALGVPVENSTGIPGTDGRHWDEDTFGAELMTGFLEGGGLDFPSNMTIAALEDLGYDTTYTPSPCFMTGTKITTPAGRVAVETLKIGDPITTMDGRSVEVLWVGHRTVREGVVPNEWREIVEIAAGALGPALPRDTLRITSDHGLLLHGCLVTAGALVGGAGIRSLGLFDLGGAYTVYHIETRAHAIILAEGTPAETFIDYTSRLAFDNYAEYEALYGEGRAIAEMPYPRVSARRLIRRAARAQRAA